jgi:PAS domain S-box-containing protein
MPTLSSGQGLPMKQFQRDEDAYRALFGPEDLAVFVMARGIEDCNDAACRLLGLARERLLGRSPLEFSAPVQPDGTPSAEGGRRRAEAALAGQPQWFQWEFRRDDGEAAVTLVHMEAVRLDTAVRLLVNVRDLSALWRAEASLRETETRLQQILDNASAVVFVKDPNGRYLFVNREFERLAGIPRGRIVGTTDTELYPADAKRLRESDRRVLAERRPIEIEERLVRGGAARTYLSSKFPLFNPDGEPYAVCGIATDITDRKRAEEGLQRAALAVSSAGGTKVFEELVRALATTLEVQAVLISVFVDAARSRMRTLATYLDGRILQSFEYELARTPCRGVVGREFRFTPSGVNAEFAPGTMFGALGFDSYAAYALNDASGAQLGLIAVIDRRPLRNRELTEAMLKIFAVRAAAEVERARTEEAVRASEEQYRAMFNASDDALVLWNSELKRVDVNPAYERLFGYTREEVLDGDYLADRPAEYTERRRDLVRRTLAGEPCHVELEGVRKNGERFDVEVRTIPIRHRGEPHVLAIVRDITERKRAEQALRASEEQYRAIFNATADGLTLRDADFRVVDVNPALLEMTGFTRAEALGSDRMLFTPPEDQAAARELFVRELAGEASHYECEAVRKDGRRFALEVRGVPLQYRGQPHVFVIARDITERKRAEEALRSSGEQYRAIFNATADALVLRDADFRIVDVNPAYELMSGYSRAEVIGQMHVVANLPDIEHYVKVLHGKGLAGETFHFESEGVRKDGSRFDVEVRGVPIRHQGKPHVLYIGRDITARKLADQALRASEEQYRSIFNAASDALVLRDAEARVVDVNPAFLAMSGYTREEVHNDSRWIFARPEMSVLAKEMHRRVIAGESVQFEVQGFRKDGTLIDVEMRAVPIHYRGKPHALGMARDITLARRAEIERTQLEAQLRQAQKMEAIGHLTGGIAHDFNNILTSVMGYLVLAAERDAARDDPKLAKYLNQAHLSCERARDLIQQMLTFSRGQRGERRPVALPALVKESAKLLRSTMPATLELVTELDDDVPQVMLDPVQADQVLLNLGINARDATDGHGAVTMGVRRTAVDGVVCASCRKRVSGDFVELAVRDTGPGIAPEAMDRMFEPFFSTKEVGKGSGMGLATVHGIVHEHGGHIVVQSQPGRGASFRVLFPTLPAEEGAARPARKARTGIAAPRVELAGHVMVVDDEAMVSEFMKELLEGWGLAVTSKPNGVEAKAAFERAPERFDLVVTDQSMPRVTGLQLARELLEIRPTVPVILYTGYADNLTEAQAQAAGVRALIRKPVEPAALLALLKAHLPSGTHAVR